MKHPGTNSKRFAGLVGFLIVASTMMAPEVDAQAIRYTEPMTPTLAIPSVTQTAAPSPRQAGDLPELVWVEDRWCEEIEDFCPISEYDFGTVARGSSGAYLGLWLVNRSASAPATNLSLQLDAEFLLFPDMSDCTVFDELPPGGHCRVRVKFAPSMPGPVAGAITMTSAEMAEASLPLWGTGGSDHLLYGQLHDLETMIGFFSMRNAIYANSPVFSSELADDFLVEDPEGWVIRQIGLEISFMAFEPDVDSFDVFVMPDVDGIPGDVAVCSAPDSKIHFWEAPFNESRVELILSSPCELPPGHYWLQVQLHTDHFGSSGFYGWGMQYLTGSEEEPPGEPPVHLNPLVWRNPGNVGEHGCTEWTSVYPPACGLEDWWPWSLAYGAIFWLIGDVGTGDPVPENDHIANATFIPVVNATYSGTNVHATLEDSEPEPSCTFSDWTTNYSVWWTFTADAEANRVNINTFDSDFDTILSLHHADDLSEVACDDDTDGLQSQIEDASIVAGETYLIRVAGYDQSGANQGDIQLTTAFHWVSGEDSPNEIVQGLTHPSPNPVREMASFTLTVDRGQQVTVEVFDMMGRRVQVLYEGSLTAGATETLRLDANALSSGVYVIRAVGEDFVDTRRVTVVR